jgi:hypothetical protein
VCHLLSPSVPAVYLRPSSLRVAHAGLGFGFWVLGGRGGGETHAVAARKEREMDGMRAAFGLKDVTEGAAFDRELQETKRVVRGAAI